MQHATPTEIADRVREIAEGLKPLEGPLLPILHAVQENLGHVPDNAIPVIADVLNLTAAEVHGVMSFYHDFKKTPQGTKTIKICRAEACQAMGADEVAEDAKKKLGVDWHGTTPDGAVTLEPVYCLGLCACAPAAMVDDTVHGRINERLDDILAEARS